MDVSGDLREGIAEFGEPVTLASGSVVKGIPGVASAKDTLSGDSIVEGRTRTLRFVAADVPALEAGQLLTWNAKSWRVVGTLLYGGGYGMTAFLGSAT